VSGVDVGARAGSARRVLVLLFVVYMVNFIDRNVLTILLNSVKRDLEASDTQMGLLTGLAFAALHTVAGLPIARWADRGSRRAVIALGMAFWSLATAASGVVRNIAEMMVARAAVAVGEASSSPAAHSLISDYFPPHRRASAIAVYNAGASAGIFAGIALGGWLNDSLGWRFAFLALGLPGLAVALGVWRALPEPARGSAERLRDSGQAPSLREALAYLGGLRSFRHLLVAAALFGTTSWAMTTWSPALIERVHGLSPGRFSLQLGLVMGLGGIFGAIVGGLVCDRLGRRDPRWLLWFPALACSVFVPCLAGFALAPSLGLALAVLVPTNIVNQFWSAPIYALAQGLAQLRMRATSAALVLFTINIVGMGVGPLLIGMLNDALEPRYGPLAIRYSLPLVGCASLWGALHALAGARSLRDDLRRAEEA
jgi:predicted MFS family arabinose efflux permease